MSNHDGEAFFLPLGDGRFAATEHTRGPWSDQHQHGGPPAALLAHGMEALLPAGVQLARITFELPRPVPIASASPNGLSNQPQRMTSPSPPSAYSPGVIASQRRNRSCSRPEPDSPTSCAASSTLKRSASSARAWPSARYC